MPTVCVITEAFLTVARAQQKALDYPELPFIMLEHPVAVATDAEVEHKVALIYAELVEKLTGSFPAASGYGAPPSRAMAVPTGVVDTEPDASGQRMARFAEALAPLRGMLKHDGADLRVIAVEPGLLHLQLVYLDGVCVDCIPAHEHLTGMIREACKAASTPVSAVILDDPRQNG